jgi:hypothetical protein
MRRETQAPAWAKTLPPRGVPRGTCHVTNETGFECGAQYLDYDNGHRAHHAVFGHWPSESREGTQ